MEQATHTPTPYHHTGKPNALGTYTIFYGHGERRDNQIAQVPTLADAEFIVTACNAHNALVEALKQSSHDMYAVYNWIRKYAKFSENAGMFCVMLQNRQSANAAVLPVAGREVVHRLKSLHEEFHRDDGIFD